MTLMPTSTLALYEDYFDPNAPPELDPAPFCFRPDPDDAMLHVAKGSGKLGDNVLRKREKAQTPCGKQVDVGTEFVQREPTCPGCRQAVAEARQEAHDRALVEEIMER